MANFLPTPVAVILVASLVLAYIDVCQFKIYNVFTYPLLLGGLIYHAAVSGRTGLEDGLLGALLGFGVLLPFYALGGMGGGDVKLMSAVGAWLGVWPTFAVFLASSLAAGIYALVLVVVCGRVRETWLNLQISWLRVKALGRRLGADDQIETEVQQPDRRRRLIPFAAMVAVGLLVLLIGVRVLASP
jgi:prepilin peptidase CpaA